MVRRIAAVTNFGELVEKYAKDPGTIPEWLLGLDSETAVFELVLDSGELIQDYSGLGPRFRDLKHTLAIIISGRAELFDLIPNHWGVLAYRPIRIFSRGDTFGEFELLDELHGLNSHKLHGDKKYYPRETWRIISGHQCLIPIREWRERHYFQEITGKDNLAMEKYPFFFDYSSKEYPHPAADSRDINKNSKNPFINNKTTVALIDIKTTALSKDIKLGLYETGWSRVQAYRKCINSFNLNNMLAFRSSLYYLLDNKYTNFKQTKLLRAPIADAMMDALNRPLRGEPCYKLDIASGLLYASDDFSGTFLFPIDLYNYVISLGLHHANEGRPLRNDNQITEVSSVFSLNSSGGLIAIIKDLIKNHLENSPDYPFSLGIEQYSGSTRPMLLLRYTRI